MKCMFCGNSESKVLDSRSAEEATVIRRRRECLACAKRFTTYETVETTPILVIKNNGTRQPFSADKIKFGVIKACEKRPVTISQIEELVAVVSRRVQNTMEQEVRSQIIGELVMEELKKLDDVAYVRFASVYRKFTDVTTFVNFIQEKLSSK
ncbi:MAG: transcriptional regulator NrdR [Firmicutes bacterium]|nr:transcriptional regulator NrdR [Bacillota bacterium]